MGYITKIILMWLLVVILGDTSASPTAKKVNGDADLRLFQKTCGLASTGELDNATWAVMLESRCGKNIWFGEKSGAATAGSATADPTEVCNALSGNVDAMATTADSRVSVGFEGDTYVVIDNSKMIDSNQISSIWEDKTSVDAAIFLDIGAGENLYIIKGQRIKEVKISGTALSPGSDMQLPDLLQGLPCHEVIDALVLHPQKSTVLYAFAGQKYYRLMQNNGKYTVADGYPKSNSEWNFKDGAPNLNEKVSAATLYQNRIYFFTKTDYYRYKNEFDAVSPGYPRSTKENWFYCQNAGKMSQ